MYWLPSRSTTLMVPTVRSAGLTKAQITQRKIKDGSDFMTVILVRSVSYIGTTVLVRLP